LSVQNRFEFLSVYPYECKNATHPVFSRIRIFDDWRGVKHERNYIGERRKSAYGNPQENMGAA
jgi:hypothetical protein